jgi:hypothetical protein
MEGDLQRRLGANLRSVRESRGLSQEIFADVLGVHRTFLGGPGRGERNVTLRAVERLADWVGVDTVSLLQPSTATASGATSPGVADDPTNGSCLAGPPRPGVWVHPPPSPRLGRTEKWNGGGA